MSNLSPPKNVIIIIALSLVVFLVGCSHQKTQRGHLFRGDWAFEYNRTPWIGCPPDSGMSNEARECKLQSFFANVANNGSNKNQKRFRHHCAQNAECSVKEPCCRTLGCGMWVDPNDPTTFATLGGTAKACGLLPFCSPQKPCCLTPNCGVPVNVNVNPQTLTMANQHAGMPGRNVVSGVTPGNMGSGSAAATQNGTAIIRGMNPTGTMSNGMLPNGMTSTGVMPNGMIPNGAMPGKTAGVVPGATLVSRGIVPGASAITSGGMVVAIGVATPAGMMTPVGVRLPNGVVSNAHVLRACVMTPNCTSARPCCLTPNCGGAVAVNMVANNATVLASALQAQGVASGVMQANGMAVNGMGMFVNPITNQPISGLTMSGNPQVGYPPIGYAPGHPRFAAGMMHIGEAEAEETHDEAEEVVLPAETRSSMPVPRFHSIPTKPTFQRSEGMPPAQGAPRPTPTAMTDQQAMSEVELEAALDQAYLEGVSAAMNEVERKLEEKRQAVAKAKLQEKILLQAEYVQQQLDAQEEMRILAMQREQQLRQQALRQQAALRQSEMQARTELQQSPQTHSVTHSVAAARPHPQQSLANVSATQQLAGTLKASVMSGVNEIFAPLLGANQVSQTQPRGQVPVVSQPRQHSAQPKTEVTEVMETAEVAVAPPNLPGKPPVSSVAPNYGLSDDESESLILQARFTDDSAPIRP